ncbi:MAG TPA: RNA polymerase sigma factor [Thermoanaerobaculia bacterium]|jgi:RNA polymerase sigma-70 factor (ECF subfamily)|nr:RNA polymerase sigma factor [Thermoanaerobaculia bacterium]
MNADLQLLAAIRAGDQRAFASFHDEIKPYLFNVADRRLRNREDAEEIVERAFAQFWRGVATFRADCAVKTFLTRIVINLSNNRYHYNRRRFKFSTVSLNAVLHEETRSTMQDVLPCPNADTPGQIERAELERRIRNAMERIESSKAAILRFVAVAGGSYEEAAEAFGIKVGTVKSRVSRARSELRTLLAA